MPVVDFGIAGLGTCLGEPADVLRDAHRYGVAPELAARMGFRTYHRAPAGVTTPMLAAAAGRTALERAQVDASQVDYLVVASASIPEYFNWDPSTAVARELGMRDVRTLLLTQTCTSGVLAFQYVAGLFATRDDVRTVLLACPERVSEEQHSRMGSGTTADSDGAAAVVLRRGHRSLRWLATEQLTDARYADFHRLEYGGSAAPFPPEGTRNHDIDPAQLLYRTFEGDPERFIAYAQMTDARLAEVVDNACARTGTKRTELSRILLLNANQEAMRGMARALDVPLDRTNAELAARLGHFGSADPLVCLDLCQDRGDLRRGERIALAGVCAGLHWFCTVLEV
ncbi:3-oxoacyl-ACP synthase III family protein [Streptomyces sp. B93]|uniref:3-oxoacyl-ACP synthase III family protein n=1 Tax=Streptomyces sp. B93 TaxID=2824875 RepID=UPI001B36D48D|nr:3-oxoacyl-[acyl-carrier-protein] synthase III C-terminal domain-containing protein [Streptomyces sp. B93]MBQ1089389.1 3-oxoacyl-ACP synthase [Streptomyces sp. B93]